MLAVFWPARRDSNPRPSESESAAISSFATGGCADIIAQKKAGSKSGGRAAQKYFFDGQQNWKKLLQKSEVSLIIYELLIFSATVAQLVEQLIRNQQVAGSSPASSSKSSPCSQGLLFRCRNHPHRLRRWGLFSVKPAARKTRTAGLKLCYSSAFFCSSRS